MNPKTNTYLLCLIIVLLIVIIVRQAPSNQRFVPFPVSGDYGIEMQVVLDTKTGQVCAATPVPNNPAKIPICKDLK